MEKNKIGNKKKILLLAFICICWFLLHGYIIRANYQKEKLMQSAAIIMIFIATTFFYYICKNNILRLLVMISAIVGITVGIGYKYMLTVCTAFVIIYIYKSSITENRKNENINGILLVLVPWISIGGIIVNFESIINVKYQLGETGSVLVIFMISFAVLMRCTYEKGFEKKTKSLYKAIFLNSIIGVLASALSFSFISNGAITFFPWFFFIMLMIYEEDKTLNFASEMIINKIKAFLE